MKVQFDPNNKIIRLCIMGMGMEDSEKPEAATASYQQAWDEADNDFEKFIAAYFVARLQNHASDKVKWLETALHHADLAGDDSLKSAYPAIYSGIAKCYEELGVPDKARQNNELADTYKVPPTVKGPFYHGTRADLKVGELLTAGGESNYKAEFKMNHIYFTANINGAGLAAALAKGDGGERVYIIEPTGPFEDDPNVTDKKFPGNLTQSYRSQDPLRIIGEVTEWGKQTQEDIREWRKKLADNTGEIIN